MMRDFQSLLGVAVERHGHLCAGQVLGVRMAMLGLKHLGVDPSEEPKRLIVFIEIDRCAADAVETVSGCSLGKRTLKYADYGKMAATFIDTRADRAVRVVALDSARDRAASYAPKGMTKGVGQLTAYQAMPDAELFDVQEVRVVISDFDKPGHPLRRVYCDRCHEGINDGREVVCNGETLCRACASQPYYERVYAPVSFSLSSPLLPVKL